VWCVGVLPQLAGAACGTGVLSFDELSAAQGCLGRFTGAGVMPLLRQFCGSGT
jgi:2,3-bisphosphoglycerate-independent phosphoglycerate mutase